MNENVAKYIKRKKIDKINSQISQQFVEAGLERIRSCINCGTCTGGCPSGRRTAYRTRSAIRRALIGDLSILQDIDIWECTTCYYCYERCPRNIPVTDMIIKLRNIAVQNGFILGDHLALADKLFYATGHAAPVNAEGHQNYRDLRASLDLPPLPPTVHSFPKQLEQCQKLMDLTGFRSLLDNALQAKESKNAQEGK
ncbi:MAG: CoB--CoM heterodisulfide reductase subunit C [Promethearchaeota archaeon]